MRHRSTLSGQSLGPGVRGLRSSHEDSSTSKPAVLELYIPIEVTPANSTAQE